MKRTSIVPLLILLILVAALSYRWDYGATKTLDSGIVKWKTDRWTGQGWMVAYMISPKPENPKFPSYINEIPILPGTTNKDKAWQTRNMVGMIYKVTVVAVLGWFFYGARCNVKQNEIKEEEQSGI